MKGLFDKDWGELPPLWVVIGGCLVLCAATTVWLKWKFGL
jgi:hypothetical protein